MLYPQQKDFTIYFIVRVFYHGNRKKETVMGVTAECYSLKGVLKVLFLFITNLGVVTLKIKLLAGLVNGEGCFLVYNFLSCPHRLKGA